MANQNTKALAKVVRKASKRLGYAGARAAGIKGAVRFGECVSTERVGRKPAQLPAGSR